MQTISSTFLEDLRGHRSIQRAALLIPHWIGRTALPVTTRLATGHSPTVPSLTRGNLNQPKILLVALLQHPRPLRPVVVAEAVSSDRPLSRLLMSLLAVMDEAKIAIKSNLVVKLSVRDAVLRSLAQ